MEEKQATSFSEKAGLPPGALIHVGNRSPKETKLSIVEFSDQTVVESKDIDIDRVKYEKNQKNKTWLNVTGLKNIGLISQIGEKYNLHKLVLEDILNTQHRPKIEEFDEYTFFTFKMLQLNKGKRRIVSEQISIILGENYVLTFQEMEGDTFNSVRERLANKIGMLRTRGTDYLLYALIDTVVDNYFTITEVFNENIQELEDQIINKPTDDLLSDIQNYKKDLLFLRQAISPLRDSVGFLSKSNALLIKKETKVYFNDTLDHIIQLTESINEMRDNLSSQLDIFLSNLSHQMNAVMKVLTIIATIFIPLTFIAGIYGMNFKFMPELEWYWSYPIVLGFMGLIFIGMLFYFKKKRWI